MENKYIIGFIAALVVIIGGILFWAYETSSPSSPYNLDLFAQCLSDKGVKFYGAFWCPHCQATKKMFGAAQDKLPYVECSTPDTRSQLPVCTQAGIERYPTWIFADKTRLEGETSLTELSNRTGCPLIPLASSTPQ